jgi:hypothetical protein
MSTLLRVAVLRLACALRSLGVDWEINYHFEPASCHWRAQVLFEKNLHTMRADGEQSQALAASTPFACFAFT